MADDEPILASAVVIPSPEDLPPPASPPQLSNGTSLKRRQSSISSFSSDSKRPRLSRDADTLDDSDDDSRAPTHAPSKGPAPLARPLRKPSGQEERQRGKRLFGALLGTLAARPPVQSATASSLRRRASIERRQAAKLQRQGAEDEAARRARVEELRRRRAREDWAWGAEAMAVRHGGMRARAGFLVTTAASAAAAAAEEGRGVGLCWRPFEMTEEQERRLGRQRAEVEDEIDREMDEFEERRRVALEELNAEEERRSSRRDEGRSEDGKGDGDEGGRHGASPSGDGETGAERLRDDGEARDQGVGPSAVAVNGHAEGDAEAQESTNGQQSPDTSDESAKPPDAIVEPPKDAHDDGDEVVEGDEDTVIY